MADFTKLERKVILWLGIKSGNSVDYNQLPLTEDDDIQKMRELIHIIEELSDKGYVILEEGYYKGSDSSVSFKYMNNAIEFYPERVKLSDLGKEVYSEIKAHPVIEQYRIKWGVILSNVVSFALGALVSYIIFK